jgi:hypothetical protein
MYKLPKQVSESSPFIDLRTTYLANSNLTPKMIQLLEINGFTGECTQKNGEMKKKHNMNERKAGLIQVRLRKHRRQALVRCLARSKRNQLALHYPKWKLVGWTTGAPLVRQCAMRRPSTTISSNQWIFP